MSMVSMVSHLESIYQAAIRAVSPYKLVYNSLKFIPSKIPLTGHGTPGKVKSIPGVLKCGDHSYEVDANVKIVGFGKAVGGMAKAVIDTIGHTNVKEGIISVPEGSCYHLQHDLSPVRALQGAAYNLPDHNSENSAKEILSLVSSCTAKDLVIVLITGGGSALLSLPEGNITIDEKKVTMVTLANAGASIEEVNRVRQCVSKTKAGKLGIAAYPAKVLSLILSDIIDDPLEMIASGPTVVQDVSPQQCMEILYKYDINKLIPDSVLAYLTEPTEEKHKTGRPTDHIVNVLVGNNTIATKSACEVAARLGYHTEMWSCGITGEAIHIGKLYSYYISYLALQEPHTKDDTLFLQPLAKQFFETVQDLTTVKRPFCLIGSGEPTVNVRGNGKGGRNQELILSSLLWLAKLGKEAVYRLPDFLIASIGTDGQDGPTNYAGAYVDKATVLQYLETALDAASYLDNNDSSTFFQLLNDGRNLIRTGPTGTNIMDIHIILIM